MHRSINEHTGLESSGRVARALSGLARGSHTASRCEGFTPTMDSASETIQSQAPEGTTEKDGDVDVIGYVNVRGRGGRGVTTVVLARWKYPV